MPPARTSTCSVATSTLAPLGTENGMSSGARINAAASNNRLTRLRRSPATDHRLHQECVHRQHDERHAPHPRDRRQVQDGPVVDLRDAERPPAEPAQRPGRTHPVRHGPQGGQSDRGQQRTTVTLDRRGEQTEHERGAGAQQGDRHPCHLAEPSDPIERRAVAPDPEDETHERSPCAARGTEQPQEGRDPHECERPPSEWWRRGGHEQPARERDRQRDQEGGTRPQAQSRQSILFLSAS